MSNIVFARNDGIFEMLKWKNDAKISNDADLIYRQGGTMAYIKKNPNENSKSLSATAIRSMGRNG